MVSSEASSLPSFVTTDSRGYFGMRANNVRKRRHFVMRSARGVVRRCVKLKYGQHPTCNYSPSSTLTQSRASTSQAPQSGFSLSNYLYICLIERVVLSGGIITTACTKRGIMLPELRFASHGALRRVVKAAQIHTQKYQILQATTSASNRTTHQQVLAYVPHGLSAAAQATVDDTAPRGQYIVLPPRRYGGPTDAPTPLQCCTRVLKTTN